jgi:hypothetical protein
MSNQKMMSQNIGSMSSFRARMLRLQRREMWNGFSIACWPQWLSTAISFALLAMEHRLSRPCGRCGLRHRMAG